jgi:hypothetical protein
MIVALAFPVVVGGLGLTAVTGADGAVTDDVAAPADAQLLQVRSLDGSGNNVDDPTVGQAGTIYPRVASANYGDGVGELMDGPSARYVSNRIFNDTNQNVFSENGVTHWGFVWGQFIDHTIGLRAVSDEQLVIPFDAEDPLESFTNDLGPRQRGPGSNRPGSISTR